MLLLGDDAVHVLLRGVEGHGGVELVVLEVGAGGGALLGGVVELLKAGNLVGLALLEVELLLGVLELVVEALLLGLVLLAEPGGPFLLFGLVSGLLVIAGQEAVVGLEGAADCRLEPGVHPSVDLARLVLGEGLD